MILTSISNSDFQRVQSSLGMENVNAEAMNLMKELREEYNTWEKNIKIGGEITSKNDAYDPMQGLKKRESENYHAWQIERLAKAGVDFIFPCTLPMLEKLLASLMPFPKQTHLISLVL